MIETANRAFTLLASHRLYCMLLAAPMFAVLSGCRAHHHHDHHHDHEQHHQDDRAERTARQPATLGEAEPPEVRDMLAADPSIVYLDVRTVPEFEAGHVPGSLNIPVLFLEGGKRRTNDAFLHEVGASVPKNAKVIVGCKTGGRSEMAGKMMIEAGYQNVTNMRGGFHGKRSGGKVIERGWSELGYESRTGSGGDRSYDALRTAP